MHKSKISKTSDKLVIFTILTTLATLIFGFISEHSKVTLSESSFAEEVSSTSSSKEEKAPQASSKHPAETASSTATAPTQEAAPQEEVADQVAEAQAAAPEVAAASTSAAANTATVAATAQPAPNYSLSNGNTAGAVGSDAAAQMAAATGVSQSTWEYIIARESNGNPNVANASGASGLFQTMPGWGSTATVQDQINSAINAYNAQGMSAWGM